MKNCGANAQNNGSEKINLPWLKWKNKSQLER